jgi:hypothetical protein
MRCDHVIRLLIGITVIGVTLAASASEVRFLEWVKVQGATVGSITIANIPGYGRGIIATDSIKVCRACLCACFRAWF